MYMGAYNHEDRLAPQPRVERVLFGPQQTANGRGTIVATRVVPEPTTLAVTAATLVLAGRRRR